MTWRERLVDMIRGAAPVEQGMFRALPVLSPDDQVAVYATAWRIRLVNALRTECPGLVALAGDRVDELFEAWLQDHPPHSWTLDRIAIGLDAWLEARGESAAIVDMARLDRAVQAGFSAGDRPTVTVESLSAGLPALTLQPHCTPLWLRSSVHRYRSAVITGAVDLPPVEDGAFPIAVWRADRAMKHLDIAPGLYGILEALGRGLPLAEAIEVAFQRGWVDPSTASDDLREWFRLAVEWGMVGLH